MSCSTAEILKVLICDPDPLTRAGIRGVVDSIDYARVADERPELGAGSGPAEEYDVIVVGQGNIPLMRGDVILFIDPIDRRALVNAITGGATRLVDRSAAAADIVSALRAVVDGTPYVSPSLIESVLDLLVAALPQHAPTDATDQLSPREVDVLLLIGQGNTNTDIAKRLRIRETTVRSHVARILVKLSLSTRAEAVLVGHDLVVDARYARKSRDQTAVVDPMVIPSNRAAR